MKVTYIGIEDITPERASYLLERLPHDNVLRMGPGAERARVMKMGAVMKAGTWPETHQGMLLGPNDELLDGAGRCRAVVETGVTIRCQMSRTDVVTTRGVAVDLNVPRHLSFILQRPRVLVNLAQLAARFMLGEARLGLTPEEVDFIAADLEPTWKKFGGDSYHRRQTNNVSIQLPACAVVEARLRTPESMKEIFSAMDRNDPKALPPLIYSFWRQYDAIKSPTELLIRAWRAFQEPDENIPKLTIKNPDVPRKELRDALRRCFPTLRALVSLTDQQQQALLTRGPHQFPRMLLPPKDEHDAPRPAP